MAVAAFVGLLAGPVVAQDPETPDELRQRAREIYFQEGPKAALPLFERALEEYRARRNRRGEAITLGLIGNCYKRFGDFDRALDYMNRALWLKRAVGDRPEEGTTLSHLGLLYWEMGEYPRAIESIEASSVIAEETGDLDLKGANLINLSLVYDELGEYPRSLAGYEEALAIYRELGLPDGMSDALGNLGGLQLILGRYREALGYYEQAREISERENLKLSLSQDLGNLALCKLGLGRVDEALDDFDRGLTIAREIGAAQEEAYWLKGKGQALLSLGRYGEGLALLEESVERYDDIDARGELIEALHDLGSQYFLLGDLHSAERRFERGLKLARELGHSRGVTFHLLALGDVEWRRQRLERASERYREALKRAEAGGELVLLAQSLLRLADLHRELSGLDRAREEAGRALAIAGEMHSPGYEAAALLALADVEREAGALDKAGKLYQRADTALASVGDPDLLWRVHHGRGLTHEATGRTSLAIRSLEQAVEVIEGVRNRLNEERFRAGYLQDKYEVYVDLVRLLLDSGEVDRAFQSAERLRARSYLEMIERGRPLARTEEQRRVETELRERIRQLQKALVEEGSRGLSGYRQSAAALLSEELVEAERAYQGFLDDLRTADPWAAAIRNPRIPRAVDVAERLDEQTALIEYVLSSDRLWVFVVTSTGIRATTASAGRADLEAGIELWRDLVKRSNGDDWRAPAARLGHLLIEPLERDGWLEGISRLYIVPHGVLHYLSFAALLRPVDGAERTLVEDYDLAVLPSAAALAGKDLAAEPSGSLLAMAPGRSGLRFAREEVMGIGQLFSQQPVLLVGGSASESAFKAAAGDFSVVHLASHAHFNKLNPLLSGVELEPDDEEDGDLEVHEILSMELTAQMVALSGCETALASGHFGQVPAGGEFVGLTRAFLSAGSESVLATLWEVDDRSTGTLMQSFYGHLTDARGPSSRAAALARAQRDALRQGGRMAHPYHWASFVLAGSMG